MFFEILFRLLGESHIFLLSLQVAKPRFCFWQDQIMFEFPYIV